MTAPINQNLRLFTSIDPTLPPSERGVEYKRVRSENFLSSPEVGGGFDGDKYFCFKYPTYSIVVNKDQFSRFLARNNMNFLNETVERMFTSVLVYMHRQFSGWNTIVDSPSFFSYLQYPFHTIDRAFFPPALQQIEQVLWHANPVSDVAEQFRGVAQRIEQAIVEKAWWTEDLGLCESVIKEEILEAISSALPSFNLQRFINATANSEWSKLLSQHYHQITWGTWNIFEELSSSGGLIDEDETPQYNQFLRIGLIAQKEIFLLLLGQYTSSGTAVATARTQLAAWLSNPRDEKSRSALRLEDPLVCETLISHAVSFIQKGEQLMKETPIWSLVEKNTGKNPLRINFFDYMNEIVPHIQQSNPALLKRTQSYYPFQFLKKKFDEITARPNFSCSLFDMLWKQSQRQSQPAKALGLEHCFIRMKLLVDAIFWRRTHSTERPLQQQEAPSYQEADPLWHHIFPSQEGMRTHSCFTSPPPSARFSSPPPWTPSYKRQSPIWHQENPSPPPKKSGSSSSQRPPPHPLSPSLPVRNSFLATPWDLMKNHDPNETNLFIFGAATIGDEIQFQQENHPLFPFYILGRELAKCLAEETSVHTITNNLRAKLINLSQTNQRLMRVFGAGQYIEKILAEVEPYLQQREEFSRIFSFVAEKDKAHWEKRYWFYKKRGTEPEGIGLVYPTSGGYHIVRVQTTPYGNTTWEPFELDTSILTSFGLRLHSKELCAHAFQTLNDGHSQFAFIDGTTDLATRCVKDKDGKGRFYVRHTLLMNLIREREEGILRQGIEFKWSQATLDSLILQLSNEDRSPTPLFEKILETLRNNPNDRRDLQEALKQVVSTKTEYRGRAVRLINELGIQETQEFPMKLIR